MEGCVMHVNLMLADFAQVHQGKLFISGAGITGMATPPGVDRYVINFGVGITVTIPWLATNQNHRMVISLVDSDGQVVPLAQPLPGQEPPPEYAGRIFGTFNAGRAASMEVGEDSILPLAFQFGGLEVPHPGTYTISMEIDGTEMANARFRVVPLQPGIQMGMPMQGGPQNPA
jgi:Family of unknown function (DUF6941)